jgi:hypothetical protein
MLDPAERVRRVHKEVGFQLLPRQIETVRAALRDALEFSNVRPHWLSLRARVARAHLAMREGKAEKRAGKTGRDAVYAFAREMGVLDPEGRRTPKLTQDEAELVVLKYCELTRTDGLISYVDDETLWASGFRQQAQSGPRPSLTHVGSDLIQHPRPTVQAPVGNAEAVKIIAGWFYWRFGDSVKAVREFLLRERRRLQREKKRLEGSSDPADSDRLSTMPPSDFQVPGTPALDGL